MYLFQVCKQNYNPCKFYEIDDRFLGSLGKQLRPASVTAITLDPSLNFLLAKYTYKKRLSKHN